MQGTLIRMPFTGCVVAVSLFLVLGTGCRPKTPVGTVSGKITLQGQPLAAGTVQFLNPKLGAGACVNLNATGSYKITEPLPIGEYLVAVGPFAPSPHEVEQRASQPIAIPVKYYAPTTSGLTTTIHEGANVADFPLIADP